MALPLPALAGENGHPITSYHAGFRQSLPISRMGYDLNGELPEANFPLRIRP